MKLQESPLQFRVATPCPSSWEKMEGDDRARFCAQCSKHVYNLSALSAAEAATLIEEKEGDLCGRFYQRADGTVLFGQDCPVGLAVRQWRLARSLATAAASFVLLALGVNKAQADPKSPAASASPASPIMGKICPPSTPTPKPTPAK